MFAAKERGYLGSWALETDLFGSFALQIVRDLSVEGVGQGASAFADPDVWVPAELSVLGHCVVLGGGPAEGRRVGPEALCGFYGRGRSV